jgi:hypothetical protein
MTSEADESEPLEFDSEFWADGSRWIIEPWESDMTESLAQADGAFQVAFLRDEIIGDLAGYFHGDYAIRDAYMDHLSRDLDANEGAIRMVEWELTRDGLIDATPKGNRIQIRWLS